MTPAFVGAGQGQDRDRVSRALVLVCNLEPSPAPSFIDLLTRQVLDVLGEQGFTSDVVRVVDHDVEPRVEVDMGEGDEGPAIRE